MTKPAFHAICMLSLAGCLTSIPCYSEMVPNEARTEQSRLSYEAALRVIFSSPAYVLVRVVDDNTGQSKKICTTANFLLGAIHLEHGLGYSSGDISKGVEIALASPDHTFRFHKQAALANIPLRYSDDDLAAARMLLAPRSTDELKIEFSSLFRESRLPTDGYKKDAIACALLERGLSPKLSDIGGQVYVDRE